MVCLAGIGYDTEMNSNPMQAAAASIESLGKDFRGVAPKKRGDLTEMWAINRPRYSERHHQPPPPPVKKEESSGELTTDMVHQSPGGQEEEEMDDEEEDFFNGGDIPVKGSSGSVTVMRCACRRRCRVSSQALCRSCEDPPIIRRRGRLGAGQHCCKHHCSCTTKQHGGAR